MAVDRQPDQSAGKRLFGKNVSANCFEIHIVKLHVEESLLVGNGPRPHIDPLMFMSFCRFFGMGGEVHPSRWLIQTS